MADNLYVGIWVQREGGMPDSDCTISVRAQLLRAFTMLWMNRGLSVQVNWSWDTLRPMRATFASKGCGVLCSIEAAQGRRSNNGGCEHKPNYMRTGGSEIGRFSTGTGTTCTFGTGTVYTPLVGSCVAEIFDDHSSMWRSQQ